MTPKRSRVRRSYMPASPAPGRAFPYQEIRAGRGGSAGFEVSTLSFGAFPVEFQNLLPCELPPRSWNVYAPRLSYRCPKMSDAAACESNSIAGPTFGAGFGPGRKEVCEITGALCT